MRYPDSIFKNHLKTYLSQDHLPNTSNTPNMLNTLALCLSALFAFSQTRL